MIAPEFTTADEQKLYALGLRLQKALHRGVIAEAETQQALIRAGVADPPAGCAAVADGLDLWQWLDDACRRFDLAEERRQEGQELARLMEAGHLTEADVRRVLKGVRGKSPEGAAIVAEVAASIRGARTPKARAA